MILCSHSAYSLQCITSSKAKLLCLFNFLQIYLILHHHHKTSRWRSFYLWIFTSHHTAVCLLLPLLRNSGSVRVIRGERLSTDSGASLQPCAAACALLRAACCLLWGPLCPSTLLASFHLFHRLPSLCSLMAPECRPKSSISIALALVWNSSPLIWSIWRNSQYSHTFLSINLSHAPQITLHTMARVVTH